MLLNVNPYLKIISDNMKEYRIKNNVDQVTLAMEAGVTQATISRMENIKDKNPYITTIDLVAKGMGMTLIEILKPLEDDDE